MLNLYVGNDRLIPKNVPMAIKNKLQILLIGNTFAARKHLCSCRWIRENLIAKIQPYSSISSAMACSAGGIVTMGYGVTL